MNEKLSAIMDASAGFGISAIIYLVIGLFLFLIIGIVTVVISGRKNVFKRNNKMWNIFPKLYYAYIPLVFAIFGAILGSIYGVNKSVNKTIESQSAELMEAVIPELPEFQKFIDENMDSIKVAGYSTSDLVDKYFNNKKEVEEESGFFGNIASKAGEWVMEGAIDGVIDYTADKLDMETSTAEGTINTLRSIDFNNLDETAAKIVSKNINKQVDGFFSSLYLSQLINLLVFLGIPIVEIGIYFSFFHKKAKKNMEAIPVS